MNLAFELNSEALADGGLHGFDDVADIGGRGASEVDDEIGVLGRDLGTADGEPFQAGGFDQATGRVAWRISEGRATTRLVERLRGLSALDEHADSLGIGFGVFVAEAKGGGCDDRSGGQLAGAIGESQFRPFEAQHGALGENDVNVVERIPDFAEGGAGVHAHRSTDRTRDPGQALESRPSGALRAVEQDGELHAGADGQKPLIDVAGVEFGEGPVEVQHDAPDPRIGDKDITTVSKYGDRASGFPRGALNRDEILEMSGLDPRIGATADAPPGFAVEGNVRGERDPRGVESSRGGYREGHGRFRVGVRMVIVGAGRVGCSLERRATSLGVPCILRRRGESPVPDGWSPGEPLLLAVRNDDLDAVLDTIHPKAREDVVFVQNGMLRPWLASRNFVAPTRGLLFFSASERGGPVIDGGVSPFFGPHAIGVAAWLQALGLNAATVSAASFAEIELEKLVWNSTFGLLCEVHQVSVGELVDRHAPDVVAVAEELIAVGAISLGLQVDAEAMVGRLHAYSRSIAAYRGAVREWRWRNGWFVDEARARGLSTPIHGAMLARIDAARRFSVRG